MKIPKYNCEVRYGQNEGYNLAPLEIVFHNTKIELEVTADGMLKYSKTNALVNPRLTRCVVERILRVWVNNFSKTINILDHFEGFFSDDSFIRTYSRSRICSTGQDQWIF